MLANPQAKDQSKNQKEYSALNVKIAQLYEHVACVDVGAMHQDILDSGKKYMDITGNNVNHPNDFMARVYADESPFRFGGVMSARIKKASLLLSAALAAVLLCGCFAGGSDDSGAANASSSESVASGSSAGEAELPEENNYLKDTSFEKGFRVYKTTEGVGDFHALPLETSLSNVQPDWTLAQWASKYDIIGAQRTAAFGRSEFCMRRNLSSRQAGGRQHPHRETSRWNSMRKRNTKGTV